jgi:hypothetical protein
MDEEIDFLENDLKPEYWRLGEEAGLNHAAFFLRCLRSVDKTTKDFTIPLFKDTPPEDIAILLKWLKSIEDAVREYRLSRSLSKSELINGR